MARDLSKLPKWAQDHIRSLEAGVRVQALREGSPETDTRVLLGYIRGRPEFWDAPKGATVEFAAFAKRGGGFEVRLTREGALVIHHTGGDRLAVFPSASNSIRIEAVP